MQKTITWIHTYLVQFSRSVVSDSLQPNGLQHARLPCPSPTPRVYSYSCPLSQWCHPTISPSVIPFSSHLECFPASGSSQMSQFFASGGQSMGVSASASVLPMNIQHLFPSGWTGWISLQSKGFSRAFSNTTVQKHQFFGAQISLEILNDKMLQRPGEIWQVCSMMINERYLLASQRVYLWKLYHMNLWDHWTQFMTKFQDLINSNPWPIVSKALLR